MKILFVGDEPSLRTDPDAPFRGAACEKRLYEWIAIVMDITVLEAMMSKDIRITNSDMKNRIMFMTIKFAAYLEGAPVIALGNKASERLKNDPHFKLPHPSGRNRQINDKEFIEKKLMECKEYIRTYR